MYGQVCISSIIPCTLDICHVYKEGPRRNPYGVDVVLRGRQPGDMSACAGVTMHTLSTSGHDLRLTASHTTSTP